MASTAAELDSDGGSNDEGYCSIDLVGVGDVSQRMSASIPVGGSDRNVLSAHGAVTRPAGTYTIRTLCGTNAGAITFNEGDLIVWAVAS